MVILASALVGVNMDARESVISSNSHVGVSGVGDPRPCVACVSEGREVRILRLGVEGAQELHRTTASVSVGVRAPGVLTVPSSSRHQFLLATRWVPLLRARAMMHVEL